MRIALPPLALLCALATAPAAADDARLLDAHRDHDDWLTYGHGYANQRWSELAEIDTATVARLAPRWIFQTGVLGTFATNPLVVDGTMYLTTPANHVVALEAATGALVWRYTHAMAVSDLCCGTHNRGLAWGYGRLYMVTADGRFIALEAATGDVAWDIPLVDPQSGDAADLAAIERYDPADPGAFARYPRLAGNMAPVVHDGRVFIGVSGTGYTARLADAERASTTVLGRPGVRDGLRAFLSAHDARDGRLLWRWYATAAAGWEGNYATTTAFGDALERDVAAERAAAPAHRDAWKTGGGSIYSSPSIDPALGLVYFGTGNAAPTYADERRPGDNLYTSAVVALDVATGALAWYHQLVPHDIWGYDAASPPVLIGVPDAAGKPVPALAAASKSGWLYLLDRRDGLPIRRSAPFVPQDARMFRRPTAEGIVVTPGAAGGANWPPSAYSPRTGLVYVPATHHPTRYRLEQDDQGRWLNVLSFPSELPRSGVLAAIDPADGSVRWQLKTDLPLVSGALATAGGLVFAGESNGDFIAVDAASGARLWRFATGAGVNAPPITFRAGGRQYVAVAAGGHALFKFPLGDAVIAFALPD